MTDDTAPIGPEALAARVRRGLAMLGEPPENWVPARPGIDHDVAVIGGGQSGLTVAFALKRAGIGNVAIFDKTAPGHESIWRDIARMHDLRSAKTLPGPELGLPDLTFEAWYTASFGAPAFAAMVRSPRTVWADYVDWYRETTGLSITHDTRLDAIAPAENGLALTLARPSGAKTLTVRKVVLATGFAGMGAPAVPAAVAKLPRRFYAHTDEIIDFAPLAGKAVGVLGAASSAFDAAAVALETGAASATLFSRHDDLVRVTAIKGFSYGGALDHFHEMSDADRWHLIQYFYRRSAGPMPDTVRRAMRQPGFALHLGCGWESVVRDGEQIVVTSGGRTHRFDFLILGTGYAADLDARPELAALAGKVALWRDRYVPPTGEEHEGFAAYPYLDDAFGFTEKVAGAAPFVKDVHLFNFGALASHGRAIGEISSLKHGVPRLVHGIGRDLFVADRNAHVARLKSFAVPDLTGEEYLGRAIRPIRT